MPIVLGALFYFFYQFYMQSEFMSGKINRYLEADTGAYIVGYSDNKYLKVNRLAYFFLFRL